MRAFNSYNFILTSCNVNAEAFKNTVHKFNRLKPAKMRNQKRRLKAARFLFVVFRIIVAANFDNEKKKIQL